MSEHDIAIRLMIGLNLFCIYSFLFPLSIFQRSRRFGSIYSVLISLPVFGFIAYGSVWLSFQLTRDPELILKGLLVLSGITLIGFFAREYFRHEPDSRYFSSVLLLVYLLAVGYISVFSRNAHPYAEIILDFRVLSRAFTAHSVEPIKHLIMNVAMFVPFGILLAMFFSACQKTTVYPVLCCSLAISVLIESLQLLFQLGDFDITDLLANVLGASLGYSFYRLYKKH